MKKTLIHAGAAMLFALVGAAPASAQQVVLKVHHFLPGTLNIQVKMLQPWCDKINKESNDRMKCQIYPAMQLGGTPAQLFDQARDGIVDIVWAIPTYAAGRFTKAEVFELPFMTITSKGSSQALWAYTQKNALDEFRGTKLLFMHVADGHLFHFTDKNVKSLDDLKGLKIRAATRISSRMITALGATPVQMPLPQVPESLSKGVIDGAMVPWEGAPSVKLHEIAKFHLDTAAGAPRIANSIFAFAMNQAKYDSLPADLKKVIDANSGLAISVWAGETGFDAVVGPHRKLALDRGNTLNTISDAEIQRMVKASASVYGDWKKEVGAKGVDGNKLLDEARALIKQYDK